MMNRRDSRMGRLRRRGWPEDEALATASRAGTLVVPVSKEPAMRPVVPCSIALILALFGPLAAQVDHEHHGERLGRVAFQDRKSTRLNSSHLVISYAVFCL